MQSGVFSELATILEYSVTSSPSGGQIKTWTEKAGHKNIPCYVSSITRQEQKSTLVIQTVAQTSILLSGHYPSILEQMRVVCNGITYEITSIGGDSQTVFTKLLVQKVQP